MLPKSFLQFETPRSLILAPNPLPQSPQKFNSINAPYIHTHTHTHTYIHTYTHTHTYIHTYIHTFSLFVPISTLTRDPWLKNNYMCVGSWLGWIRCSHFFSCTPSFMAPRGQNISKFSKFLELILILSLCYIITVGKVKFDYRNR